MSASFDSVGRSVGRMTRIIKRQNDNPTAAAAAAATAALLLALLNSPLSSSSSSFSSSSVRVLELQWFGRLLAAAAALQQRNKETPTYHLRRRLKFHSSWVKRAPARAAIQTVRRRFRPTRRTFLHLCLPGRRLPAC